MRILIAYDDNVHVVQVLHVLQGLHHDGVETSGLKTVVFTGSNEILDWSKLNPQVKPVAIKSPRFTVEQLHSLLQYYCLQRRSRLSDKRIDVSVAQEIIRVTGGYIDLVLTCCECLDEPETLVRKHTHLTTRVWEKVYGLFGAVRDPKIVASFNKAYAHLDPAHRDVLKMAAMHGRVVVLDDVQLHLACTLASAGWIEDSGLRDLPVTFPIANLLTRYAAMNCLQPDPLRLLLPSPEDKSSEDDNASCRRDPVAPTNPVLAYFDGAPDDIDLTDCLFTAIARLRGSSICNNSDVVTDAMYCMEMRVILLDLLQTMFYHVDYVLPWPRARHHAEFTDLYIYSDDEEYGNHYIVAVGASLDVAGVRALYRRAVRFALTRRRSGRVCLLNACIVFTSASSEDVRRFDYRSLCWPNLPSEKVLMMHVVHDKAFESLRVFVLDAKNETVQEHFFRPAVATAMPTTAVVYADTSALETRLACAEATAEEVERHIEAPTAFPAAVTVTSQHCSLVCETTASTAIAEFVHDCARESAHVPPAAGADGPMPPLPSDFTSHQVTEASFTPVEVVTTAGNPNIARRFR